MSYTVRRVGLRLAGAFVAAALFYGIKELTGSGTPIPILVAVLLLLFFFARSGSLLLKVDAEGVHLGRGIRYIRGLTAARVDFIPWSSVREVVLFETPSLGGGSADAEVGLRLRPDVPLPDGVSAIVYDPADPDAVGEELRVRLPARRLDPQALRAAVTAYGGGVPVVVSRKI